MVKVTTLEERLLILTVIFSIQGKVGSILSITYVGYAPMQVKVTKLEGNKYVMKEDAKSIGW